MAIYYVDCQNGSDVYGDGTVNNPFASPDPIGARNEDIEIRVKDTSLEHAETLTGVLEWVTYGESEQYDQD